MKSIQLLNISVLLSAFLNTIPHLVSGQSCDENIKRVFDSAASFVQGMEPIELTDQMICKKVVVNFLSTTTENGSVCPESPGRASVLTSSVKLRIAKLHVECHTIPLSDFGKLTNIPIPIPSFQIPALASSAESDQIIVVDGKDLDFDFDSVVDFEEDSVNINRLELAQGQLDDLQISLKGNQLFTSLGEKITKPQAVRSALGQVIKFALRHFLVTAFNNPQIKDIISLQNSADDK